MLFSVVVFHSRSIFPTGDSYPCYRLNIVVYYTSSIPKLGGILRKYIRQRTPVIIKMHANTAEHQAQSNMEDSEQYGSAAFLNRV